METGARLVERVRARDVAAFESLYDGYHRLVFGIALRMLGDAALAEDVTGTVFLKVWNAPDGLRGGSPAAQLSRLTRSRVLELLRSRAAHPDGELPSTEMPLEGSPDDESAARVDARRVRDALAALPPEQRALIELGFFGGVTHQELAARTGTPLGTVKATVRSGLHALHKLLENRVTL